MEAKIVITQTTTGTSQTVTLPEGERLVLGRSLTSPAALEGTNISREHFAITMRAGKLTLEDLSSNGTWVNSERLPRASEVNVRAGDLIEISGYRIEMNGIPSPQASASQSQNDSESEPQSSTSSESGSKRSPVVRALRSLEVPEVIGIVACLCSLLLFIIYSLQ
jgi:predicted component of type VI protein secretion system